MPSCHSVTTKAHLNESTRPKSFLRHLYFVRLNFQLISINLYNFPLKIANFPDSFDLSKMN